MVDVASFGGTNVGLIRKRNEDVWHSLPERGFYALSDGMGGHLGGDIAAAETVGLLCDFVSDRFPTTPADDDELTPLCEQLAEGIDLVNGSVYRLSRSDRALRGMGATLCCIYFGLKSAIIAHIGDSRIYLLREGRLTQLTRDHSLVTDMLNSGQISEEEAEKFIYKHVITRAVGTKRSVTPTMNQVALKKGDLFLLCSDGLTDDVPASKIEAILKTEVDLDVRGKALIQVALDAGGRDNVTVVLTAVV